MASWPGSGVTVADRETTRTVKVKFAGDQRGLERTARAADRTLRKFDDAVDSSRRGFGAKLGGLVDDVGGKLTRGLATIGDKLPGALSGAVGALPPQGQALALVLVGGLTAALVPLLGAAITTAVLLGVGGGVLAAGIAAAAGDKRVGKAFGRLSKAADKAFENFGQPFEKPLIRAAKLFESTVTKVLGPALKRMGALMAPLIDKLAPALDKFFRNVMPGIESAVAASVPLFTTLAEHLPKIGTALGTFFTLISANGDDANAFFDDLLTFIEGLIVVLGGAIAKMAEWYSSLKTFLTRAKEQFVIFKAAALREIGRLLDGAVKALGWIPGIGPKLRTAQTQFRQFQESANREVAKVKNRTVKVTIISNVGEAVAGIINQLAKVGSVQKQLPRRASGGPAAAGRDYLVGERGPEILRMGSSSGTVIPNRELTGDAGGDLYLTLDLGRGIEQRFKIERRDLKRRAAAGAHT